MARSLASKPNVVAPGGNYPFGRIKDKDATAGTPINEQVYGDLHQFFERMMSKAGVSFNGLSENSSDGFQYFQALLKTIGPIYNIGIWDMDANGNKNVSTGLSTAQCKLIRSIDVIIIDDSQTIIRTLDSYDVLANNGTVNGGMNSIDAATGVLDLRRKTGGIFDDIASYATSPNNNRGWVKINMDLS